MTYLVEDICSFEKLEDLLPQVLTSMATRDMVKGNESHFEFQHWCIRTFTNPVSSECQEGPHVFIWPYVSSAQYFTLGVLKYNMVSQLGTIDSTTLDEALTVRSCFKIWKYSLHISMITSCVFVHLGMSAFRRSSQSRSRSWQNSGHLITLIDCNHDN